MTQLFVTIERFEKEDRNVESSSWSCSNKSSVDGR